MKTRTEKVIEVSDWDDLVIKTYGRPYSLQQQDGCKERGRVSLTVPAKYAEDYKRDTVPEEANHETMGVSFAAWQARDPKQKLKHHDDFSQALWWERNFYPELGMVANDLHAKGLLEAGTYSINIDW